MPDFKPQIRASIARVNLSPEREVEIVEELTQHLQEQYEEAIRHGASGEEANRTALKGLAVPDSLVDELKRVEFSVRRNSAMRGRSQEQVLRRCR